MFSGRTKPVVSLAPIEIVEDGSLWWILEISDRTLGKSLVRGFEVPVFNRLEVQGCEFSDSLLFDLLFLFLCCVGIKSSDPGGTSLFEFFIVVW